jgi:hypothetical protein
MIEIKGKHNTAKVFTDTLEKTSRLQIQKLCDQPFAEGSVIRLMPDVHAGVGCTIGTTMTITDNWHADKYYYDEERRRGYSFLYRVPVILEKER